MKTDQIIEQRFSELEKKMDEVAKSKYESSGYYYFDDKVLNQWSISVLSLLKRIFGEKSDHYINFNKQYQHAGFSDYSFESSVGIFLAAKEDYESGYLFTVRGLVKAEDTTDILDQAEVLLKNGYKDPACVLAGVSLEITLKELCNRNGIPIAKLETMNQELTKKEIYNLGMQKQITAWAHLRNKAAHGEFSEYKDADVDAIIKGVTRFVADYL